MFRNQKYNLFISVHPREVNQTYRLLNTNP